MDIILLIISLILPAVSSLPIAVLLTPETEMEFLNAHVSFALAEP
jgi:hypothetical protein